MNIKLIAFFIISILPTIPNQQSIIHSRIAIIGGGTGGLTALAVMLECGVPASQIIWIDGKQEADPEAFNVGALGNFYSTVPGNSKVKRYVAFLQSCKIFDACKDESFTTLQELDPEIECDLTYIVRPLQTITNYLRTKVSTLVGRVHSLAFNNDEWHLNMGNTVVKAYMVVLATGSHPKKLSLPGLEVIPLEVALNREQLAKIVTPQDTVAIFGSSHSAILSMKFLNDLNTSKIINFYNKPYILRENGNTTGVAGVAAQFAKEVLEKKCPDCIERYEYSEQNLAAHLPRCNKVIYAIGFSQNNIEGVTTPDGIIPYDESTGTIGPRLFGIGIAFPEKIVETDGHIEPNIGIMPFMEYALKVVPSWLQTRFSRLEQCQELLKQYNELFDIKILG